MQVTSADHQSLPPDGSDYVASEAGARPLSPSDLPSSSRASPLNDRLLGEGKVEERVQLRLVHGSPNGASDLKAKLIYKYQNRREVIAALIAIVLAHKGAANKGIIHRDMTISNMYIIKRDDGTTSGFLGDWDFADIQKYLEQGGERRAEPVGPCGRTRREEWPKSHPQAETHHRTGSTTFLPVEVQYIVPPPSTSPNDTPPSPNEISPPFLHEAHHDLQSTFLVMLALFTAFGKDHAFNEETITAVGDFFSPKTWWDAGKWKFTHLCDRVSFISHVTPRIDNYWVCIRDDLVSLQGDVFGGIRRRVMGSRDHHLFENPYSNDPIPSILSGSLYLTNVQPITHDKFLDHLYRMLKTAEKKDEADENDRKQVGAPLEQEGLATMNLRNPKKAPRAVKSVLKVNF